MKKNEKDFKILTGAGDIAPNSFITFENEKSRRPNLLPYVYTRELVKDTLEIMRDKIKQQEDMKDYFDIKHDNLSRNKTILSTEPSYNNMRMPLINKRVNN